MSERDKAIEEAMSIVIMDFDDRSGREDEIAEMMADFALAYHAKQNAEAEKLREDALKFYSADGSFTLGESPEQVIQARIEAAAKIEKLAKLEAWVSSLGKAVWRDGEICNRGEYGFALYDHSGAIIEHYPTLLAAIYAYLEQAEGGEE